MNAVQLDASDRRLVRAELERLRDQSRILANRKWFEKLLKRLDQTPVHHHERKAQ